jgi:hypothetical protein
VSILADFDMATLEAPLPTDIDLITVFDEIPKGLKKYSLGEVVPEPRTAALVSVRATLAPNFKVAPTLTTPDACRLHELK